MACEHPASPLQAPGVGTRLPSSAPSYRGDDEGPETSGLIRGPSGAELELQTNSQGRDGTRPPAPSDGAPAPPLTTAVTRKWFLQPE